MTLAFITTLRHPQNAVNYDTVELLLRESLASITSQTDDDYVVFVVGNRRPSFPLPPRVHFVPVDFEPPAPPEGSAVPREAFVADKGAKIGIGLIAARTYNPDFVMIFDADDFVHRDITMFAKKNPHHPGWYIDDGWMYSRSRGAARQIRELNRTCGTCHIIPYNVYKTPANLDVRATKAQVIKGFGDRLHRIMGAHRDGVLWFHEHGYMVEPLPFSGTIYHVDTGENKSGKTFIGRARPLKKSVADEFGVRRTRNVVRTWWLSAGPSPTWESYRPVLAAKYQAARPALKHGVRSTASKLPAPAKKTIRKIFRQ